MPSRDHMIDAIRRVVVPVLREHGYSGAFPHFRRIGAEYIDLLTFRFDKWGGRFVVEVARCGPEGHPTYWGEHIPPEKVRADDVNPSERLQLGAATLGEDHWFRFDGRDSADTVAWEVVTHLDEAEEWLRQQAAGDADEQGSRK